MNLWSYTKEFTPLYRHHVLTVDRENSMALKYVLHVIKCYYYEMYFIGKPKWFIELCSLFYNSLSHIYVNDVNVP